VAVRRHWSFSAIQRKGRYDSFSRLFVSLDGKEKIEVDKVVPIEEWKKVLFCSRGLK
jgi:hypothetical protein